MHDGSGLRVALELYEVAVELVASRYRREHPDATEAEVTSHVDAWRTDRPGAPFGDAVGIPRSVDEWRA